MGLYRLPSIALLTVAVIVAVAVSVLGQRALHRRFRSIDFEAHNQVGGVIVTIAGTLYAVVLGFITVVVWQQYQGAEDRLSLETAAVSDAWHTAVGYPQPVRSHLRRDLVAYASDMIATEWPLMHEGRFSIKGDALIMDMSGAAESYIGRNSAETTAQMLTTQNLVALHDARLRRLSSNNHGLKWIQWTVLGAGGVIVVAFCYLFGMRNEAAHLAMTSAVTILIVTMIVLIYELQYPFRGDLGIGPDAWLGLMQHIRYMDTTAPMNMRM